MPRKIRKITLKEDQVNTDPAFKYAIQFDLVPNRFKHPISAAPKVLGTPSPVIPKEVELEVGLDAELAKEAKQMPVLEKSKNPILEDDTTISPFTKWLISKKLDNLDKPKTTKKKTLKAEKTNKKTQKKEDQQQQASNLTKTKLSKEPLEQSILLSTEIISETLAEVLQNQGHTKAAIEMYEKLSLKYPEKSIYFADLIKKLK